MSSQIIYTFELRKSENESIKLVCGDPWSFQDQNSAKLLFTKYLCDLWSMNIDPVLLVPYMSKGLLITNDKSKYIKFSMLPDKIDLNEYKVLM